ncbi:hypothetical protein [Mycobacterium tilburgii]|uniref:hypothetical protein n=1 Tax=Mycobacterium tilburgii TaxID=44467 RepID=UPI0021B3ADBE|nr:hypothetical protein [Mycobacterium tilburgii]
MTVPTETAVATAFGYTAVLAGRPGNQAPLREIGRLFGRIAHLLDAVEDHDADLAHGKWNPLAATASPITQARVLCDDAALGIELALAEVEFNDGRQAQQLLTREVRRAISHTFTKSGNPACGTPHGQQEPINFGDQPPGGGYLNAGRHQPRKGARPGHQGQGRRGGVCCCDGCYCCCDC